MIKSIIESHNLKLIEFRTWAFEINKIIDWVIRKIISFLYRYIISFDVIKWIRLKCSGSLTWTINEVQADRFLLSMALLRLDAYMASVSYRLWETSSGSIQDKDRNEFINWCTVAEAVRGSGETSVERPRGRSQRRSRRTRKNFGPHFYQGRVSHSR